MSLSASHSCIFLCHVPFPQWEPAPYTWQGLWPAAAAGSHPPSFNNKGKNLLLSLNITNQSLKDKAPNYIKSQCYHYHTDAHRYRTSKEVVFFRCYGSSEMRL